MNEATKLNRQQRRRAERAIERVARKSDRIEERTGGVLVDRGALEGLTQMQRFFVGMVKEQGRVRISKATLDSLTNGDSVQRKDVGDAVILTFAAAPQEGTES